MPTYDYQCNACGHTFELFQQMSDPVKRKCPKCGKPKLERLIGIGAGVLFKGGGFYETDYRSDSYTKAAEADKKAAEPKAESAEKPAASSSADAKANGSGADTSSKAGTDQSTSASAGVSSARKPSKSRSNNSSAKGKPRRRK